MADKDKKQLLLRLSPTLWEEISRWAEDDFRSINGQIEYLLTEAVKKQAYYDREADVYYFWVTQEQYEELTADYFAAWELAKTNCEPVKYTYKELFKESE